MQVRFTSECACWVSLPAQLTNKLYQGSPSLPLVLEVRPAGHSAALQQQHRLWYVAWGGQPAGGAEMHVPVALAQCLGIAEGITVQVRLLDCRCLGRCCAM